MFASLITSGWIFLVALDPQQANAVAKGSAGSTPEVTAKLRAETTRLHAGHASEFFGAMIEAAQAANREDFTEEMLDLIEQADQVAREALRSWLDRALASPSRQPTLDEWQHLKARVVGHAEAIVLEGVLRPEQARRWRDRASQPLMPSLAGRYSLILTNYPDGHFPKAHTRAEYYRTIHNEAFEQRSSDLFGVLLGYGPPRRSRRVPPKQAELAPGAARMPPEPQRLPGLKPRDVEVLEHMDLLALQVRKYWWLRDVEIPPAPRKPDPRGVRDLPPTPAMELRLSDQGRLVRESIAAHAEEIALEAVLTPELAESAKLELWRSRGVHALLDPELAARLRLTKTQRAELADALKARIAVFHDLARTGAPLPPVGSPPAVVEAYERQQTDERTKKVDALDQPIWEILSPSQLRALAGLLKKPVAGYDPAKPKAAKPRLMGREG